MTNKDAGGNWVGRVRQVAGMWVKICANTSLEDAQMAVELGADAVGFVFAPSARRVTPEEAGAITAGMRGEVERVGVFPDWEFEAVRDAVRVAGLTGVQIHGGYRRELVRRLRGEFGDALTIAQTLHWEVAETGETGERAVAEGEPTLDDDKAVGEGGAPGSGAEKVRVGEHPTLADDETVAKDGAPNPLRDEAEGAVADRLLRRVREMVEDGYVDRVLVDSKVGAALGGTGQVFDWEAAEALFRQAGTARMIVAGGLKAENVGEAIGRLRPWGVDVASGVEAEPGRKDPERLRAFIAKARGVLPVESPPR